MYRLYAITVCYFEDSKITSRTVMGDYKDYETAMRAGCELVWRGKADDYEVLTAR